MNGTISAGRRCLLLYGSKIYILKLIFFWYRLFEILTVWSKCPVCCCHHCIPFCRGISTKWYHKCLTSATWRQQQLTCIYAGQRLQYSIEVHLLTQFFLPPHHLHRCKFAFIFSRRKYWTRKEKMIAETFISFFPFFLHIEFTQRLMHAFPKEPKTYLIRKYF